MKNISTNFEKEMEIEKIGCSKSEYFIIQNLLKILQNRKNICEQYIENKHLFQKDENLQHLIEMVDWHNKEILNILNIKL